jgi:membrane protein
VVTDALKQASGKPRGSSVVATLVGIVLALWSASAGMVAVQTGLDVIYDVPEERTLVKKRVRALVLIAVAVVLGGVATAAIVFGQPIGDGIRAHLPFGGAFILVWTIGRWVVGLAALAALFAAFYYLGPNRDKPRWTWLSPGGLVATLIWLLASLGFSFYVSSLGSYAKTYGSLTGVVVLMLWLYLSALALLLGAEVNAQLELEGERVRRRERRGSRRARHDSGGRRQQAPPQAGAAPSPTPPNGAEQEWLERMRAIRSRRA